MPHFNLDHPDAPIDDGYTSTPTHLRIYWEETGDEYPWHIDGADNEYRYTEAVWRFATQAEAFAAAPRFITETTDDGGVEWRWDSGRKTRLRHNDSIVPG